MRKQFGGSNQDNSDNNGWASADWVFPNWLNNDWQSPVLVESAAPPYADAVAVDIGSTDSGPDAAAAAKKNGGTTSTTTSPPPPPPPPLSPPPPPPPPTDSQSSTSASAVTSWQTLAPPTGDTSLPTDSYFANWQWALTKAGTGIDVINAWKNYTGAGIKIGVIDDGFDYNHTDIKSNYRLDLDYDSRTGVADAFGDPTADFHGTTVMGVIGAARDGTGIVGVAYNSQLTGFRIGFGSNGTTSQVADAFNHVVSSGMDVVNASWGYTTPYSDNFYSSAFSPSQGAILDSVMHGRGGLGIDVVFAAGNFRASGDNANYHNFQNSPFIITVGATDSTGHVASFSTPGASLLVSAPGTGVWSDDRIGSAGYSTSDYVSSAGTSYAAPYVSSVIALMLQANPNLGYRDVQEILAYSAKETDPTNPSWHIDGAHDFNGGGLHFSEDYGFGLVDATAAVRLAESWQYQSTYANMATVTDIHTESLKIPDGVGNVQSKITLANSMEIDKIVVDLNITHASPSDLLVTLTSPFGTTATLANHPTNGTGSGIVFETSANNFWGENTQGTWTLTVTDTVTGNTGTLNGWTMKALGDASNTPAVYIYTDEYATLPGADRGVLHDSSGAATINTAAVTTGSYLDLTPGAIDTIAGKTLQIGLGTLIKNVWAGDGNDTIIANSAGNTIQGGRGNDTIVAGSGVDKLFGGVGSDTFVWNALTKSADTIADFTAGQDTIDLHQVLSGLGYNGTNALADGWVTLTSDGNGGTNVAVDAHNGQAAVAVVDVLGVASSALHGGANYWTLIA